jgi:hypothetical protein
MGMLFEMPQVQMRGEGYVTRAVMPATCFDCGRGAWELIATAEDRDTWRCVHCGGVEYVKPQKGD